MLCKPYFWQSLLFQTVCGFTRVSLRNCFFEVGNQQPAEFGIGLERVRNLRNLNLRLRVLLQVRETLRHTHFVNAARHTNCRSSLHSKGVCQQHFLRDTISNRTWFTCQFSVGFVFTLVITIAIDFGDAGVRLLDSCCGLEFDIVFMSLQKSLASGRDANCTLLRSVLFSNLVALNALYDLLARIHIHLHHSGCCYLLDRLLRQFVVFLTEQLAPRRIFGPSRTFLGKKAHLLRIFCLEKLQLLGSSFRDDLMRLVTYLNKWTDLLHSVPACGQASGCAKAVSFNWRNLFWLYF